MSSLATFGRALNQMGQPSLEALKLQGTGDEELRQQLKGMNLLYDRGENKFEYLINRLELLSNAPHKNYSKLHCSAALALSHIEYLLFQE